MRNGRPDSIYQNYWRCQPREFSFPKFKPRLLFEKIRGKMLMFVGDSLNRNQWESMVCMVQSVAPPEQKTWYKNGSLAIFKIEFYNTPINEYQAKLVFKPLTPEWKWKLIYESIHQDVRILSEKIPVTKFLNLQVGVGHNFQMHATGWKWKLTTCLGVDGVSRIRSKTSVGLFPGFDLWFGWRADYVLPKITGALGTDEPLFNMQSGRLQALLDRVEAILTDSD